MRPSTWAILREPAFRRCIRHSLRDIRRRCRARDRKCTLLMPGRRDPAPQGRRPPAAPPAPGLGPEDTRSRSTRKGHAPAVTRREVGRRPIDARPVAPLLHARLGMSPAMATCSCGGRFNLDVQYLFDARRFSLLGHVPILWRCAVCGRSLVEGQPAAIAGNDGQELRRGAARAHGRPGRDADDDAADFAALGVGSRSRRAARGPARSRISRRP